MAKLFPIISDTNRDLSVNFSHGLSIKNFFHHEFANKLFLVSLNAIIFFVLTLTLSTIAHAASVTLTWERNQEPDIAGYKIFYGTRSRTYTNTITLSDRATQPLEKSYTITGLQEGQIYYFSIKAYDLAGQESDFSPEVSIKVPGDGNGGNGGDLLPGWYNDESWIEVGTVSINHSWKRITLTKTFKNPVVIVGPPSFKGTQPCVIRVRNVGSKSFEMRLQEWLYLDGWHLYETVPYLVIEAGVHNLPDGTIWEAGRFKLNGTLRWKKVTYPTPFPEKPVVFQTIQTFNGPQTVLLRQKNVTADSFYSALQEEEKYDDRIHYTETIGYLAVEKKSLASLWANVISADHNFKSVSAAGGRQFRLEEEASKDKETFHITEQLGILNLDGKIFTQIQSFIGADPVAVRIR